MVKSSLSSLIGSRIRVDRGGPESRYGRLLAVKDDHMVVEIENEGIVYYKLHHIKSITKDASDLSDLLPPPSDSACRDESIHSENKKEQVTIIPAHLDAETFDDVLQRMKYRWVQINRGGPEKIQGVMTDSYDDHILLVSQNEVSKIFHFHIRNISYGTRNQNNNEKNNDEGQDKQNKNKNQNNDK